MPDLSTSHADRRPNGESATSASVAGCRYAAVKPPPSVMLLGFHKNPRSARLPQRKHYYRGAVSRTLLPRFCLVQGSNACAVEVEPTAPAYLLFRRLVSPGRPPPRFPRPLIHKHYYRGAVSSTLLPRWSHQADPPPDLLVLLGLNNNAGLVL